MHQSATLSRKLLRIVPALLLIGLLALGWSSVGAQDDSYTIPEDPEGMEPSAVVATVGDEEITLGYFRARIRYERAYFWTILSDFVAENGPEVMQLNNPSSQIAGLLSFLADDQLFGNEFMNVIVNESLYRQEAAERGLELEECEVNNRWARYLGIDELVECEVTEAFEQARADFIATAQTYSGLTEDEITNIVVSALQAQAVQASLREDVEVEEVDVARTRHIRVTSEEAAQEVLSMLEEGADFNEVLVEYTADQGADGNGGELGVIRRGQVVAPFEEAAFNAEVGAFVGPVQTDFGFHILQVNDRTVEPTLRIRTMLLETEDEAETAVNLLEDGEDFGELARLFSIDARTRSLGGEMGFITELALPNNFEQTVIDALLAAEVDETIGPIQTTAGWGVYQVTDRGEEVIEVDVRHILVDTEEEALAVLERLEGGEDFNDVAREVSIDGTAAGHQGDTMTLLTGRTDVEGLYSAADIPAYPDLADAVFAAEVGDIVGPIQTNLGYVVVEVQELSTRPPTEAEITSAQNEFIADWEVEQLETQVDITDGWRAYVPHDPMASEVADNLEGVDEFTATTRENIETRNAETRIPLVLGTLVLPEPEPEPEPEVTPEPEATEEPETTPEPEATDEPEDGSDG